MTADDTTTEDRLLNGRVVLRQARAGYRAGMDAALLAAACVPLPGHRVIEAGCGPGAALLAAASRYSSVRFTGVEADPAALALAQANIVLNRLEDRVQATAWDVREPFNRLGLPAFDAAMANPPFFEDDRLRGPSPERHGAYVDEAGLAAWTGFLIKAVREGGAITLIHRTERLAEILALLSPRAGSFRIRPLQPFADEPAKRVLVRAVKTGKAPLVLLPPLVLHERNGAKHTPEVEAILRGETELGWG